MNWTSEYEYPYYSKDKKVSYLLNKGSLFCTSIKGYDKSVVTRLYKQFNNMLDREKDAEVLKECIPELIDRLCHSTCMPFEIINHIVENYFDFIGHDYRQKSNQSYPTFANNPNNFLCIAQLIINKANNANKDIDIERAFNIIDAMFVNVEEVLMADIVSVSHFTRIISFMKENNLVLSNTLLLELLGGKMWSKANVIINNPVILKQMEKPNNINTIYIIIECDDIKLIKSLMDMTKQVSGFGLVKLFESDIEKFAYVVSTGKVSYKNILHKYHDPVPKNLFEYIIDTNNSKMLTCLLDLVGNKSIIDFELVMGLIKANAYIKTVEHRIAEIIKAHYKKEFERMYLIRMIDNNMPETEKDHIKKINELIT